MFLKMLKLKFFLIYLANKQAQATNCSIQINNKPPTNSSTIIRFLIHRIHSFNMNKSPKPEEPHQTHSKLKALEC